MIVGIELSENPVTRAEEPDAVHVNKVPVTFDVNVMPVEVLLQTCEESGTFDRSGVGKIVTI